MKHKENTNNNTVTEKMLDFLREDVRHRMSEKRYAHTVAVEEATAWLASVYLPEKTEYLRAAALLHDITKELSAEEQMSLCRELHVEFDENNISAPKTFHAMTASALIKRDYPEFDIPDIVNAVRYHTTGHKDMTMGEYIVYLADYIDKTRTFPDCIKLREHIVSAHPESLPYDDAFACLMSTLKLSFDMTIEGLISENSVISPDTIDARNDLLIKIKDN